MTTKILDHADQAVARLPSQHSEKVNIVALVRALSSAVQDAEDGLHPLFGERDLENAIGAQLDLLGKLVLLTRSGLIDENYRLRLRAKIRANRSNGLIEDLIEVSSTVLQLTSGTIVIQQLYPAAVVVEIDGEAVSDTKVDALIELLRKTILGGVKLQLHTSAAAASETFYTAVATTLTSGVSSGVGSLTVSDTSEFPDSGIIRIDEGLTVEEDLTYTSKTATTFTLSGTTSSAHSIRAGVTLPASTGKGFGDSGNSALGGSLSSIVE